MLGSCRTHCLPWLASHHFYKAGNYAVQGLQKQDSHAGVRVGTRCDLCVAGRTGSPSLAIFQSRCGSKKNKSLRQIPPGPLSFPWRACEARCSKNSREDQNIKADFCSEQGQPFLWLPASEVPGLAPWHPGCTVWKK